VIGRKIETKIMEWQLSFLVSIARLALYYIISMNLISIPTSSRYFLSVYLPLQMLQPSPREAYRCALIDHSHEIVQQRITKVDPVDQSRIRAYSDHKPLSGQISCFRLMLDIVISIIVSAKSIF
jgi:hypothetical protein